MIFRLASVPERAAGRILRGAKASGGEKWLNHESPDTLLHSGDHQSPVGRCEDIDLGQPLDEPSAISRR